MENIGKKLVEKFCKHQGYGNYSVKEDELIKAINKALDKAWQDGVVKAQNNAEVVKSVCEHDVRNFKDRQECEKCGVVWIRQ